MSDDESNKSQENKLSVNIPDYSSNQPKTPKKTIDIIKDLSNNNTSYNKTSYQEDFKNIMFDIDIEIAKGNAQDGITGRFTFAGQDNLGSVIRLEPNEDLQFIVQDDLSSLQMFKIMAEGSEVTV